MMILIVFLFGAGVMNFLRLNIEAFPDPVAAVAASHASVPA